MPFSDHEAVRAALRRPPSAPEPLVELERSGGDCRGRGRGTPAWPIRGFSIDTRSLRPGDVFFVAVRDKRDGHDFVPAAFRAGAVAAIVASNYQHVGSAPALLRVADPLAALVNVARAARLQLGRAHHCYHWKRLAKPGTRGNAEPVP